MSKQHKDIDNDNLHDPIDFDTAPNESALVKNTNSNVEWRSLSELGDTGPEGPPGTTLLNIEVADINDASPELSSLAGVAEGDVILVHEKITDGPNPVYIYVWDTNAGTVKDSPPFIVPGDSGTWVNADPIFFNNKCSADQVSASTHHGRIIHAHREGRWYGLHGGTNFQMLSKVGYNRSALTGTDVFFHENKDDKVKTKTLSSNTTLTFSGYQFLDEVFLEIQSTAGETLEFPSYASIQGKYDTSGVINFVSCRVNNEGLSSTGNITVINNAIDAGDTIIVNGVPLVQGADWEVGLNTDETAFNICSAISQQSSLVGVVSVSVSGSVITVDAYSGGVAGDAITLVLSDGATANFTLSGATLSGGTDGQVQVRIWQPNQVNIIELQNEVNINTSTGIIDGGELGVNGGDNTLFDITDGNGVIIDAYTDPSNITRVELEWSGLTAETPIALGINEFTFIGLENAGTMENPVAGIVQQVTPFTSAQRRNIVVLGVLVHVGMTVVEFTINTPSPITGTANRLEDLIKAIGITKIGDSSGDYTANATDLEIQRSESIHEGAAINYGIDKADPDRRFNAAESPVSSFVNYRDGSGSIVVLVGITDIDPDFYDDGSGTLAAMPVDAFQIKRLYYNPGGSLNVREYGQVTYNTMGEAEASLLTGDHVRNPEIDSSFSLQTWIIVREGTTDLSVETDVKFIQSDRFGQVPFKNYLTSLPIASQAEAEAGTADDKLMTPERVLQSLALNATPATKEMFFSVGSNTANEGTYSVKSSGSTAGSYLSFFIPHDFTSLVSVEVIGWTIATVGPVDIDLNSSYAAIGESVTTHQETETTNTYNFTANEMTAIDASSVFSDIAAGDFCGLHIDHNGIGTTAKYLGIKLRYN